MITTTDTEKTAATEREAITTMRLYDQYRSEREKAEQGVKMLGGVLRDYLAANKRLWDGESRLEAFLQQSETTSYDVVHMPDGLVLSLAKAGVLKVDNTVLKALQKGNPAAVDGAAKFRIPGEGAPRLQVVKRPD